jgi:hypothetical protein
VRYPLTVKVPSLEKLPEPPKLALSESGGASVCSKSWLSRKGKYTARSETGDVEESGWMP